MKHFIVFALIAVGVLSAPHGGHGTSVDEISEQLYGAWDGIDMHAKAKPVKPITTVDEISDQLYGAWGGIAKHIKAKPATTVDEISEQLYGAWGGIDM
ncbi:hypothetical protein BKA61DRAFT_666065 [Leptodontidium sp. MPI-SDFR-AT-0119]|nr:hypothetical protein BKA61DRAFT_666065 [Leptodontidium sp. MPI-SDFR-AT-0119]